MKKLWSTWQKLLPVWLKTVVLVHFFAFKDYFWNNLFHIKSRNWCLRVFLAYIIIRTDDAVYWIISWDGEYFDFYFTKNTLFFRSKLVQFSEVAKTRYDYSLTELKVNAFTLSIVLAFHDTFLIRYYNDRTKSSTDSQTFPPNLTTLPCKNVIT